jgi:hypothetical protein
MEELNLSMVSFRSSIFERTKAKPTPEDPSESARRRGFVRHPDAR